MTPAAPVASPCIGVCHMDGDTGWCAGCLRTLDEIARWSVLDDVGKLAVCAVLPQRRLDWRRSRNSTVRGEPGAA